MSNADLIARLNGLADAPAMQDMWTVSGTLRDAAAALAAADDDTRKQVMRGLARLGVGEFSWDDIMQAAHDD